METSVERWFFLVTTSNIKFAIPFLLFLKLSVQMYQEAFEFPVSVRSELWWASYDTVLCINSRCHELPIRLRIPYGTSFRISQGFYPIYYFLSGSNGHFLGLTWNSEEKSYFAAEDDILAAVNSQSAYSSHYSFTFNNRPYGIGWVMGGLRRSNIYVL